MRLHLTAATGIMLAAITLPTDVAAHNSDTRTWTDATGTFTVVAELVGVNDGKVRLKRPKGDIVTVSLDQLSSADQQYLRSLETGSVGAVPPNVPTTLLTGKPEELKNDDGLPAGKKSFPRGIASAFTAPHKNSYMTAVQIHGSRYGTPRAPREDFHVTLCDKDFKEIADFTFAFSKFDRGNPQWVTLRCKPTLVPSEFIICLNFNPTGTKGVYVSHDKEGESLVGLPGKPAGGFTAGDWLLRASVDRRKTDIK